MILSDEELNLWMKYRDEESSDFVHVWTHLRPYLKVDIGVDDDGYYKYHNHPLWLYFKNSYDTDSTDWLPLCISPTPHIPLPDSMYTLKISDADFAEVVEFARDYSDMLRQIADGESSAILFDTLRNMNIPRLPSDLTFQQFRALAMREPDLKGPWLYELEVTNCDTDQELLYPVFEVDSVDRYIFSDFHDAEKHMSKLMGDCVYRFVITQIPIGALVNEHGTQWLYDSDGKLLARTITRWDFSGNIESKYFGPAEEKPRFRKGDIVEVIGRGKVNLAVVASEPPPLQWYWEHYQKHREHYYFDASDEEMYYLLEGPGYLHHTHASSISLMAPRREVPDDIRRYFEYCLECADIEDCKELYHTDYFSDREAGDLGRNEITILYDKDSGRHRLSYVIDDDIRDEKDRRMMLPGTLDPERIQRLKHYLSAVMYGKSRLWYLIRDWNERHRDSDTEPPLSPETSIDHLL